MEPVRYYLLSGAFIEISDICSTPDEYQINKKMGTIQSHHISHRIQSQIYSNRKLKTFAVLSRLSLQLL